MKFDIAIWPLWDWCLDLLSDVKLAHLFTWQAQRKYKYNVTTAKWVRFFDEPWTGNPWWEIQVRTLFEVLIIQFNYDTVITDKTSEKQKSFLHHPLCR